MKSEKLCQFLSQLVLQRSKTEETAANSYRENSGNVVVIDDEVASGGLASEGDFDES
jgi:hypothetical protein